MPGNIPTPGVFELADRRIADPDDTIRRLRMNTPCKHFPGTANAVLFIPVRNPQIRVRIRCQDRLAVAEQPRFDFFDADPITCVQEMQTGAGRTDLLLYLFRRDVVGSSSQRSGCFAPDP